MRSTITLLAAAALVLAQAPRGEAAPALATPVNGGDRVFGTIDAADDRDNFQILVAEGARLSASVKATGRSGLLPLLELLDPSGVPVDLRLLLVGESTRTVGFSSLGVRETGIYTVSVAGSQGTSGDYQAVLSGAMDRKVKATVQVPAGGSVSTELTGVDGATVAFTVVEKGGAAVADAAMRCPHGNDIPGTRAVRRGSRLSAKRIVLDRGPGRYAIVVTGSPAGPATVEVAATVRFPKVRAKKVRLGAEPRPAAIDPWSGRDGTSFAITGTGFLPGATVIFEPADEAADVTVVSAGEIRGRAPQCDASDRGVPAIVSVLNPDGQFGSLPAPFSFLGTPAPRLLQPTLSPLEGGLVVTVAGSGFRAGYSVEVDGTPSPLVTRVSPSLLTFVSPAHAAGEVDVVVTDEYGRPGAALHGFWYSGTPSVQQASPSELSSLGGAVVTLTGSGFVPGVRVFVGGREATVLSVAPMASLSFTCPSGEAGPVEVEVRDPLGRSFRGDVLVMTPALHNATATAVPAAPPGTDFFGATLAAADLTGDGAPEILVATDRAKFNAFGQKVNGSWFLENDGSGAFRDATGGMLPGFPGNADDGQADSLFLGDLDGDGDGDAVLSRAVPLQTAIAYVDYEGHPGYYDINFPYSFDWPTQVASLFLENDGIGRLKDSTAARAPSASSTPCLGAGERWQAGAAALGDLDGDGDSDLLLVAPGEVRTGSVASVRWTYIWSYYYGYIKDKAILTQESDPSPAARPLFNDGAGAFSAAPSAGPGLLVSYYDGSVLDDFRGEAVAIGDLDGDDDLDAVILDDAPALREEGYSVAPASAVRVLDNDGAGNLAFRYSAMPEPDGTSVPASGEFWQGKAMVLADLDGDGDPDLVVGRPSLSTWTDPESGEKRLLPAIRIFRNDGSGAFSEDTASFLPEDLFLRGSASTLLGAAGVAAADLDGDGDVDLVVTGRTTTVPNDGNGTGMDGLLPSGTRPATRVLLNGGGGSFRDATPSWIAPGDLLPADSVEAVDVDRDGNPDVVLAMDVSPGTGKRPLRVLVNR